jgi:putative ABC transport system substrate-binding protein
MRRREFIAGLGGAVASPLVSRAQPVDRMRQVGVIMEYGENDAEAKPLLAAFIGGLSQLGWIDGANLQLHVRWGAENADRFRLLAKEMIGLRPDVILVHSTIATAALHRETSTIPIVFVAVSDPITEGFIAGLPRPGGNITGFMLMDATIAGKLVGLLVEAAPGLKRVAILFNPDVSPANLYYVDASEASARALGIETILAPVRNDAEIAGVITSVAREAGSGLVLPPNGFILLHRGVIISLAAQNKLPTIFANAVYTRDGGLLSYGPNQADIFRRSASYVDRILRGQKPSELPVQLPTKLELTLNLKTAKTLGLTIPETLLATADEVIQ